MEKFEIKVTNHLTGEITDLEVNGPDKAKDLYLELSASESAIKKAKGKLRSWLDEWLGQDNEYKFADGKTLRRTQRESKQWTIEGLKQIGLDNDAIAVVCKVDMTLARNMIKEMVERGEVAPNAQKVLNECADVNATKPFVEVR